MYSYACRRLRPTELTSRETEGKNRVLYKKLNQTMTTRIVNFFTRTAPWIGKSISPNFADVLTVKGQQSFVHHLIRMVYLLRDRVTPQYVRIVISYLRFLVRLRSKTSMGFVVKYLKVSQILLIQSAADQRPKFNSRAYGVAVSTTRCGLPRLIPKSHRRFIRIGSPFHIRFWMTLLALYRVIDAPSVLKIGTVITPGVRLSNSRWGEILGAIEQLLNMFQVAESEWVYDPSPITTRGATSNPAQVRGGDALRADQRGPSSTVASILSALKSWRNPNVQFGKVAETLKNNGFMANFVEAPGLARLFTSLGTLTPLLSALDVLIQDLGRIGYKEEPAGKLRVFAMVDAFSQWILTPIHRALFSLLRQMPTDATFDQPGAVIEFTRLLREKGIRHVYSLDLTAATDRLPLDLQTVILSYIFGDDIAQRWARFLVDRWYTLPPVPKDSRLTRASWLGVGISNPYCRYTKRKGFDTRGKPKVHLHVSAVKYACGQPMGARSSWAMLALTHHVIIFAAMRRVGLTYRPGLYLVLGDDVVIADEALATAYLDLITELGCEINMSKSLVSRNGSFEFAKRFISNYEDCTPVSWRELFVARFDVSVLSALAEKIRPRPSTVLAILDHGYKAISRMKAHFSEMSRSEALLLLWLSRPGSHYSTLESFSEWMASISFNVFKPNLVDLSPISKVFVQLMLDLLRQTYPTPSVRTENELRELIRGHIDNTLSKDIRDVALGYVNTLASMLWTSVWGPMRESDEFITYESRGLMMQRIREILKSPDWRTTASFTDSFFAALRYVEDQAQRGDDSVQEFIMLKDVVTLNKCTELRWAEMARRDVPILVLAPRFRLNKVEGTRIINVRSGLVRTGR